MQTLTRRSVLITGASILGATKLAAQSSGSAPVPQAAPQTLMPATCGTKLTPTDGWTNIPEYLWGAPERASFLADGEDGQHILVVGRVLTTRCQPVASARLEFWHTNSKGEYDMAGFTFRGLQFADKDGRFRLETVMPGYYSPQRHIHFLVGARVDVNRPAALLTNAVGLPTDDEIRSLPETTGRGGVMASGMWRDKNVLIVPYDIVMDIG